MIRRRRRSSAWLAASALLVLAACTPPISLEGRPGPCASGYTLCHTTGYCMTAEEAADPKTCARYLMIRQGATLRVPVPGARPGEVTSAGMNGLGAVPVSADGNVFVDV